MNQLGTLFFINTARYRIFGCNPLSAIGANIKRQHRIPNEKYDTKRVKKQKYKCYFAVPMLLVLEVVVGQEVVQLLHHRPENTKVNVSSTPQRINIIVCKQIANMKIKL